MWTIRARNGARLSRSLAQACACGCAAQAGGAGPRLARSFVVAAQSLGVAEQEVTPGPTGLTRHQALGPAHRFGAVVAFHVHAHQTDERARIVGYEAQCFEVRAFGEAKATLLRELHAFF